jgi:glutamine synthetase type III
MGYVNELRLLVHDMLEALKNPETIEEKGPELMAEVRKRTDHLEMIVDQALWPVPKYREILFLT